MTDTPSVKQTEAAERLRPSAQRRAARGVVAAYIHELSGRHRRDETETREAAGK